MRLGLVELRLLPDDFWTLTPAELMLMLDVETTSTRMSRGTFSDLAARFPDKNKD